MLDRFVSARLAAQRRHSHPKSSPAQRLRRAVAEVLEDRRLLTVVPVYAPGTTYVTGSQPRSVVAVDVNNDGNLDFLTADSGAGTVTVRRGRGDGTFRPATTIAVGSGPISVFAADLNGDGKQDFVVALAGTDELSVYLGAGDGATFTNSGKFAAGDLSIDPYDAYGTGAKVMARDFNGDGKLDLAVTNPDVKTVSVLLGQGNGQFGPRVITSVTPDFTLLGIASRDFNGDGKADLAVSSSGELDILLATSGGNFTVAQRFGYGTGLTELDLSDAHDIVLGDLTGDGVIDLAVVNGDLDSVEILKGASNGTFSPFSSAGTGLTSGNDRGPVAIVAADLNNDGTLDLAVANLTYRTITVLSNDGTGHFPGSLAREAPVHPENDDNTLPDPTTLNFAYPYDIAAGDYNNDGKIDLITANEGNIVTLLLNKTSDPSFPKPVVDTFYVDPSVLANSGDTAAVYLTSAANSSPINRVQFFEETNGTPGLQADEIHDTNQANYVNGAWTGGVSGLHPPGTYTVYALVTDAYGQTTVATTTYKIASGTTIAISDLSQNEGNSGTTAFNFTVTRSGDVSGVSTVSYLTADGISGATAGSGDYVAIPLSTLTFNAGETTKTITVLVNGDGQIEPNEKFNVYISDPTNATIIDGAAVGTILNDDVAATPPAAPSGLVGTVMSNTRIDLRWTDNAGNESGYEVQRSLVYNFQNPLTVSKNGQNVTAYTDNTLAKNTYYYFRVRYVNAAGPSAWSNSVKVKTLNAADSVTPPIWPGTPSATANSSSQITVTWADGSNNETGFRIQRSLTSDFASFSTFTVGANVTSFVDTGLAANTTYFYRVQSYNSGGYSNIPPAAFATTFANPGDTLPNAPTAIKAVADSSSKITVTWQDNSSNETGFRVWRSRTSDFSTFNEFLLPANATSFSDTGLSPSTQYFYKVVAYNGAGNIDTAPVNTSTLADSVTTGPLAAPSNLAGTPAQTSVALSWKDNSNNESKFEIQISSVYNYATFTTVTVSQADLQNYVVQNLSASTWYYFRIRAVNDTNVSGWSNSIKLKTLA